MEDKDEEEKGPVVILDSDKFDSPSKLKIVREMSVVTPSSNDQILKAPISPRSSDFEHSKTINQSQPMQDAAPEPSYEQACKFFGVFDEDKDDQDEQSNRD